MRLVFAKVSAWLGYFRVGRGKRAIEHIEHKEEVTVTRVRGVVYFS